jgi:hypothetical protein
MRVPHSCAFFAQGWEASQWAANREEYPPAGSQNRSPAPGTDYLPPTLRKNREEGALLVIVASARIKIQDLPALRFKPKSQNPGANEYPRDTPNRVARGELNS